VAERASEAGATPDTTKAKGAAYEMQRVDVTINVPKDKPKGTVALRGLGLVTMTGNEVIPNGDIVVRDNKIVAIGPRGKVTIPPAPRSSTSPARPSSGTGRHPRPHLGVLGIHQLRCPVPRPAGLRCHHPTRSPNLFRRRSDVS